METVILLIIAIFIIWWALVTILKRRGILERVGATAHLFLLLLRTQRGKNLLTKLSTPVRFWRILFSAGIIMTIVILFWMLFLLINALWIVSTVHPEPTPLHQPQNILLIPGVNQYGPLVAGWIGIFMVLIVHEFSHAIAAIVEKVRVKSLGIILAVIPLGAFAELDAEQMFGVRSEAAGVAGPTRAKKVVEPTVNPVQRMRISAAGIFANIISAFICFLLLYGVIFSAFQPIENEVVILGGAPGSSAEIIGIPTGAVIMSIAGIEIKNLDDYQSALLEIQFGDIVELEVQFNHKIEFHELPVNPPVVTISEGPDTGVCNLTSYQGQPVDMTFNFVSISQYLQPGELLTLGVECSGTYDEINILHEGGTLISGVLEGTPAAIAGLTQNDIILTIDGSGIGNISDFFTIMGGSEPEQSINVEYERSGQINSISVILAEHPSSQGTGYLGVYTSPNLNITIDNPGIFGAGAVGQLNITLLYNTIRGLPGSPEGWLSIMGLPIIPITEPYSGFGSYGTVVYTLLEPAAGWEWMGDGLFWLHDILFWFAWISLVAATFNAIPMVPLDGGYIFRDGMFLIIRRIVKDEKRAEKITTIAVSAISSVVLFTLIFIIIGPYLF